jgi:hypothetical protein
VGVLNCGEANAHLFKSLDNKYAIVITRGMMNLLHKYNKFLLGRARPDLVVYCNRKEATTLSAEDLREYASEMIETYKQVGVPYGAMIKLDLSLLTLHALALTTMELFIICHELGHFLNGDLDDKCNFSAFEGHRWLMKFDENKNHTVELGADLTGYALFRDVVDKELQVPDKRLVLIWLNTLFDILHLISAGESFSHPEPMERLLNIADRFFGRDAARAIEESYRDPMVLLRFLAKNSLDEVDRPAGASF